MPLLETKKVNFKTHVLLDNFIKGSIFAFKLKVAAVWIVLYFVRKVRKFEDDFFLSFAKVACIHLADRATFL